MSHRRARLPPPARGPHVGQRAALLLPAPSLLPLTAAALVALTGPPLRAAEPPVTPPPVAGDPGDATLGKASTAAASPTDAELERCVAAFGESQRHRREGKLIAARVGLRDCASERCPPALAERCVRWLGEVEQALPTIIVAAHDQEGTDRLDVRVWLDGKLVAERLDGRPWPVDPGPHVLRFDAGGRLLERKLLLLTETEKNRRIVLVLGPWPPVAARSTHGRELAAESPAPEPSGAPWIHPFAWGALAVAGAALVVAVPTGAVASARLADVEERCPASQCSQAEADDYRSAATLARVATVGFILAGSAASAGLASALALDAPAASLAQGASISPVALPGYVGLRGSF